MAEGMTTTGLNELRRSVEMFPAAVTAALRQVARATAARVEAGARERIQSSRYPARARAITITTDEDAANKRFVVIAAPAPRYPANMPLWIEHGTIRVPATPFMRPAAKAEEPRYVAELAAAAEQVAQTTFAG